jgi:hypothetical protein
MTGKIERKKKKNTENGRKINRRMSVCVRERGRERGREREERVCEIDRESHNIVSFIFVSVARFFLKKRSVCVKFSRQKIRQETFHKLFLSFS